MTPKWYVPRRTVLRGMGTGVALPFLEAMVGPKTKPAAAAGTSPQSPRRFVGIWGLPCGLVGKWDPIQNTWVSPWTPEDHGGPLTGPDKAGFLQPFWDPQYQASSAGEPLSKKLTILTGVSDVSASHQWLSALLTPGRLSCKQYAIQQCGPVLDANGPSAEQIAAKYLGQTDIESLVIGTHPPWPETDAYRTFLSWKDHSTPMPKDIDPGVVFDKLFTGTIDPKEDKVTADRRKAYKKSVLDTILGHARSLQARIGKADQGKLGQYLDGIRDIETNIAKLVPLSCTPPPRPEKTTPGAEQWQQNAPQQYINHLDKRLKLMTDLLVKAFECDRTRAASFTYIDSYGAAYGYPFLNSTLPDGTPFNLGGYYHHDMSHYLDTRFDTHQGNLINRPVYMDTWGKFVVKNYAYLASELDKRLDPDGNTLLDNSAIIMSGDMGDSSNHSWPSSNLLVLGRAGRTPAGNWGINAGRHVRVSSPWPNGVCGNYDEGRNLLYCRDGEFVADIPSAFGKERMFVGEHNFKEVLWGMLNAVGVPEAASAAWAKLGGFPQTPVDLTFSGKV